MKEIKTLREVLTSWPLWGRNSDEIGHNEAYCAGWRAAWYLLRKFGLLDLRILNGVGLVALDLKRGVRELFRENEHAMFEDIGGTEQAQYYDQLKAILIACNIVPVDETIYISDMENGAVVVNTAEANGLPCIYPFDSDDIIAIAHKYKGKLSGK